MQDLFGGVRRPVAKEALAPGIQGRVGKPMRLQVSTIFSQGTYDCIDFHRFR